MDSIDFLVGRKFISAMDVNDDASYTMDMLLFRLNIMVVLLTTDSGRYRSSRRR